MLSWPYWLTDSGRLTHKVIIRPASSLAQDRESSPAETSVTHYLLLRQLACSIFSRCVTSWAIIVHTHTCNLAVLKLRSHGRLMHKLVQLKYSICKLGYLVVVGSVLKVNVCAFHQFRHPSPVTAHCLYTSLSHIK